MIIFPAIDLFEKKAVRLVRGNYGEMTVYSDSPVEVALEFKKCGATHIHTVDLEGAKDGTTPNLSVIAEIARETGLFVEAGGGIRSMKAVEEYLSAGVSRVILGTAAVNDEKFLAELCSAALIFVRFGHDERGDDVDPQAQTCEEDQQDGDEPHQRGVQPEVVGDAAADAENFLVK